METDLNNDLYLENKHSAEPNLDMKSPTLRKKVVSECENLCYSAVTTGLFFLHRISITKVINHS